MTYDQKAEKLAKLVGMRADVVRAAGLDEERLTGLFNKAVKNDRIQNRIVAPLGAVAMALFFTSVFVSQSVKDMILLPFAATFASYLIGSMFMNKAPAIRDEVKRAAMDRLVVLDKSPAP
jgi:hypothetical protein